MLHAIWDFPVVFFFFPTQPIRLNSCPPKGSQADVQTGGALLLTEAYTEPLTAPRSPSDTGPAIISSCLSPWPLKPFLRLISMIPHRSSKLKSLIKQALWGTIRLQKKQSGVPGGVQWAGSGGNWESNSAVSG